MMTNQKKIKVLIVDDHEMVRYGLAILLNGFDHMEVVGQIGDPRMLLTVCSSTQPDVVLMDILMPHINGIMATGLLRDKFPHIQVVALTSTADEERIASMLKAGAISYILKTGRIDDVVNAVEAAYYGKPTLAAEATNVLLSKIFQPNKVGHDLSKQEIKVLELVVEGLSNREIAERLVLSQATIKAHVRNILAKLRTKSRTKAIAITIRSRLLDDTKQSPT